MRWEELEDALEELQSEREYDGYFCSIQDAVIIVTLASMCELKSVKRILCYGWLLELLALIKPDSLNRCMMKFVASLCPELIGELEKVE